MKWKDAREQGITDFMCSVFEIINIIAYLRRKPFRYAVTSNKLNYRPLSIQLKPVREDVMRVLEAFSSSLTRQNYELLPMNA
jgi:hypothetical protein